MSILVTTIVVAGGVLLGRWIARGNKREADPTDPAKQAPKGDETGMPPNERDLFKDFPCRLGDVLLRSGGDEAWLAGALVFSETDAMSVLFVAPEAGTDVAVYVRPRPSLELSWLGPVDASELAAMPEPPTSIEHRGTRFERQRRLPLRSERVGTGAPDVGEQVIVAEYTAGTERLVIVAGGGSSRAWRGTSLEQGMYEVIPSGKSTLDS